MARLRVHAQREESCDSESYSDVSPQEKLWFGLNLPHIMTDYRTAKRVVIRSPWLQIPHCTMMSLIFFYIIFYQLLWNLSFMVRQDPDVAAVGRLQKPITDWFHCTDEDFDCYMRVPDTRAQYCQGGSFGEPIIMNGTSVPHRTVHRCWRNDVHQELSTTFMIPTMVTFIAQSWSPGSDTEDWTTYNVSEYYIEDIEAFTVRLFHSFLADQVGLHGRAEKMQGFFRGQDLDAPLQHIPCDGSCDYVDEQIIDDLQACGDSTATINACFASPWGNAISVQTILGAVYGPATAPGGLHLDMPRPDKPGYTYRQAGHAIRLEIEYFNLKDIFLKFWRHWDFSVLLEPTPAYTLYFRPVLAMQGATVSETEVRHPINVETGMPDPTKRILHRTTGIWTTMSHAGEVGAFSMTKLLVSLVTAVALFKLGNLAVEHILTRIYMRMGDTAHVGMLWHLHKEDRSLHCHEWKEVIQKCTDPEIVERVVSTGRVEEGDLALLRRENKKAVGRMESIDSES